MALKVFQNVGHFFATAFKAIVKYEPKVVAGINAVESTKGVVEGATAAVGQAQAIPLEDAAFAALGGLAAALNAGDAAVEQKLLDAGVDETAIQTVKSTLSQFSNVATVAKAL